MFPNQRLDPDGDASKDAFAPRKKNKKLKMAPKLQPMMMGPGRPEPNMQMGMDSAKEAIARPPRGFGR